MDRRRWLASVGAAGAGLSLTWWSPMVRAVQWLPTGQWPIDAGALRTDSARVFDLSVSSADPSPTGVVLWTHIAEAAVRPGEPLYLQVALDERFQTLLLQARIEEDARMLAATAAARDASNGPDFVRAVEQRQVHLARGQQLLAGVEGGDVGVALLGRRHGHAGRGVEARIGAERHGHLLGCGSGSSLADLSPVR